MRLHRAHPDELVRRAQDYLEQSTEERTGLTQTAQALGTSPSSLAAAFRTVEGVSFYRFALNLRLARAAALLPASDDLARLAFELGFASHSHFSTAFHRWAGRTPSDFRDEAKASARIVRGVTTGNSMPGSGIRCGDD
jgi:AraC family transcriptional regulator